MGPSSHVIGSVPGRTFFGGKPRTHFGSTPRERAERGRREVPNTPAAHAPTPVLGAHPCTQRGYASTLSAVTDRERLRARPRSMPDMLVTVTLYDVGPPVTQMSGPAMIKTLPSHPLNKVCGMPTNCRPC